MTRSLCIAAICVVSVVAEIPQIGCDGDDDDPGMTGLGGYEVCGQVAAALNKLDGVSDMQCGGYYPFLYNDQDCDTVAAALNSLIGKGSNISCNDEFGYLAVPQANCPAVQAGLTAILQGPTCKHGNPIPGPSGGGNCTGACDQGWQGSNCDSPSPPTALHHVASQIVQDAATVSSKVDVDCSAGTDSKEHCGTIPHCHWCLAPGCDHPCVGYCDASKSPCAGMKQLEAGGFLSGALLV